MEQLACGHGAAVERTADACPQDRAKLFDRLCSGRPARAARRARRFSSRVRRTGRRRNGALALVFAPLPGRRRTARRARYFFFDGGGGDSSAGGIGGCVGRGGWCRWSARPPLMIFLGNSPSLSLIGRIGCTGFGSSSFAIILLPAGEASAGARNSKDCSRV